MSPLSSPAGSPGNRHFCLLLNSVRITWKPEYAEPPHLFSLPHRANAVAEYLGSEGPHTYFSVIRLAPSIDDDRLAVLFE